MNVIERAISHLSPQTQSQLAFICGQKPQAISRWIRTGIVPAHHCPAIETATHGAVRVDELRPDVVWQRDPKTGAVTGYLVEVSRAA